MPNIKYRGEVSMNYSILDDLIRIEKKSDASKEKKQTYLHEMKTLLFEEGYSKKSEYYIIKGFTFAGTEPLAIYMQSLSEQQKIDTINQIISGVEYRANKSGSAFKLLINLLAHAFILFPDSLVCIETIINEIPLKSKNKEGRLLGDASKTVEKYFVSVLSSNTKFPDMSAMQLKETTIIGFCDLMLQCLNAINSANKVTAQNLSLIKAWIENNNLGKEGIKITVDKQDANLNSNNHQGENNSNKPLKGLDMSDFAQLLSIGVSRLNVTAEYIKSLDKGMNTLQNKVSELNRELERMEQAKFSAERERDNIKAELTKVEGERTLLTSELSSSKLIINEKETAITSLKLEVDKLNSVMSVYSSDKENSQSEQLNAIASKLKAEFIDFSDAENDEMSVELGENFRHQIKSIFKILAKSGINVGGR